MKVYITFEMELYEEIREYTKNIEAEIRERKPKIGNIDYWCYKICRRIDSFEKNNKFHISKLIKNKL